MNTKKTGLPKTRCTITTTMEVLGGKWAIPIIYQLFSGTKRFKELERAVSDINTRMLVKELKNLEAHGVLRREAFATVPPTVEYSLTARGQQLEPIVLAIYQWGEAYLAE